MLVLFAAIIWNPPEVHAGTCYATTVAQVNSCLVNNTTIIINQNLVFNGTENIDILNKWDITIKGANSGITLTESQTRVNAQNAYYMIWIRSSHDITIKDLKISSPVTTTMCRYGGSRYLDAPCTAPIAIDGTTMTTLDNITIDAQKTIQISAHIVDVLSIKNSRFQDAATFGIWLAATLPSHNDEVKIYDNEFFDAGANAILIHNTSNSWIGNNYFEGNHKDNQYFGYEGGQVFFDDNIGGIIDTVSVTGNTIEEGGAFYASGIEMASFTDASATNISINYNTIKNHSGNNQNAIYINTRHSGSTVNSIEMKGNILQDNDKDILLKNHIGFDVFDNFHKHGATTSGANFSGTAKTCQLPPGKTRCNIEINWSSINVSDTKIYVRSTLFGAGRSLFASGSSGQQNANWISTAGYQFELVSGTSTWPYATINVKAVP